MLISILCTDPKHPIIEYLHRWMNEMSSKGHSSSLCYNKTQLTGGDVLFLVSCSQIIGESERGKYKATLVLHASDLPKGRGWSPHVWSILNGNNKITVSLIEAADPVDTGSIWGKTTFALEGHELLDEINAKLFSAELHLMSHALKNFYKIVPVIQSGDPDTYLPRRTPEDSRIDPQQSIASQFELLRVADFERYPAFFEYRGNRYLIRLEKANNNE